jgi:hypothetical protein
MDWLFSVTVSVTGNWRFPPLVFCFWRHRLPRRSSDERCILFADVTPLMGAIIAIFSCSVKREPEQIRFPIGSVTSAPLLRYDGESQRLKLSDCWCDGMAMYPVLDKLLICNW